MEARKSRVCCLFFKRGIWFFHLDLVPQTDSKPFGACRLKNAGTQHEVIDQYCNIRATNAVTRSIVAKDGIDTHRRYGLTEASFLF